jgi:cobalt/nickel transport system permease protein
MHIPDGYLSPSSCATLFGAAVPFWTVALNRIKKTFHTRAVPTLSLFSAFCFVIMMFNLPLPGGTTGHAVGMGAASIVLGPWASILAISVALLVQALFFGDGGITAFGANCFNMAIVGSLVSYLVYRVVAQRSALSSSRRVIAAGLAGYVGINASALCAAVEFGLQPLLFHDASGAPLYAPYPLSIALPAMMIGHLSFAGLAEFVISSGIVGWLQKADPEMLRTTAPDAPGAAPMKTNRRPARALWVALGLLVLLTPVGILAVGSAWGEWSVGDFTDASARKAISAASGNMAAPAQVPAGLARLSSIWNAPLARYAPDFISNTALGYLLSALTGVAIIALLGVLLRWRLNGSRRRNFIEKTTRSLLTAAQDSFFAEQTAAATGFLQQLDPRVKIAGLGVLIAACIAVHRLQVLLLLLTFTVLLAFASKIGIRVLATRVWLPVLAFTGVIAAPSVFLTPGTALWHMPLLGWAITLQGLRSAAFLLLRAETCASLSVLLILTTLWTQLLRALRFFRVPVILVAILGMTYRFLFLLLRVATDMYEARESRLIGNLPPNQQRRLAASTAGVLLGKTMQLTGDVHLAMQARGFRGEVRLLDDLKLQRYDWLRIAAFFAIASCAIWWGR